MPPGQFAVDPDGRNAFGRLLWIGEARRVADRGGVEQNEIGPVAFAHEAATSQAEALGRHARHLVDGHREREQFAIARVVAQHAWKCAPQARMRQRIVG